MQQIKKELQQAIAKLKGEWGINNFSLQDLAAILEKVVAAVDKAAQLPVVPTQPEQPEFVGGVIVAKTLYTDEVRLSVEAERAPIDSVPALYGDRGTDTVQIIMYRETDRSAYSLTEDGNSVYSKYKHCIIICSRGFALFDHDVNGAATHIREIGTNVYNH